MWFLLLQCALGAPSGSTVEEHSPEPVLPPELITQVALDYPSDADDLHGDVSVLVDVASDGSVSNVRVESGPPVFHQAALDAASKLAFEPATRAGVPVSVTTRVFFHFAPPEELVDDSPVEIVVHADDDDLKDTHARETLRAEALERSAGADLAETLDQVAGVTTAGGTTDAAKPIIRGQQERRLLVLYDGIRHESQKWGPDHATEIDPFAAGSISVIRGAAGARYGPDAIGGVVLVEPPQMLDDEGVAGKLVASMSSNGLRPYGALRLDAASDTGWSWRVEGNASRGASLSAPDYVLGNTGSSVWNLGSAVRYRWTQGELRLSVHHHDSQAGVFYGVGTSSPTEFEEQLDRNRPATADLWTTTYVIDRPYQDVTHDVATLHSIVAWAWGTVENTYAFQLNHRREFEQVRGSVSGPQYDFVLRTHSVDTLITHDPVALALGDLGGGFGLQGSFQENVYSGLALLPNYRSFTGGLFGYERLSLSVADLEVGARYDALSRTAFMPDLNYEALDRRDALDEENCTLRNDVGRCQADYDTASISVGGLVHLVPESFDLKVDLSSASRFPNVDELYILGSAPTLPAYASGDATLGVETSYGGSLTGGLRLDWLHAELSGFGSYVSDYIYFAPELGPGGQPRFDVTARGAFPSYSYRALNAWHHGADGSVSLGPDALAGLELRGALVRSVEAGTGTHLVGTPPDTLGAEVIGRPRGVAELEFAATVDAVAEQTRTDPAGDFGTPPPGYVLLGLSSQAEVGRVRVGLDVHNLLNTAYREYTSLLRYYSDQPGRDVRLRFATDF